MIEWKALSTCDVLPVTRRVVALDDRRRAIQAPQPGDEGQVGFGRAFGDDDERGAAQIRRWFAQRASGQEVFVAER